VRAGKGRARGEVGDHAPAVAQHRAFPPDAARAERHQPRRQPVAQRRGRLVALAEHGHVARLLAVEDAGLGGAVAVHVAVAVQMVGREVEHRRHVEAQPLRRSSM
jgi:hypothetical protein